MAHQAARNVAKVALHCNARWSSCYGSSAPPLKSPQAVQPYSVDVLVESSGVAAVVAAVWRVAPGQRYVGIQLRCRRTEVDAALLDVEPVVEPGLVLGLSRVCAVDDLAVVGPGEVGEQPAGRRPVAVGESNPVVVALEREVRLPNISFWLVGHLDTIPVG